MACRLDRVGRLRVEVHDNGSPSQPRRRTHYPDALSGRGCVLFDALAMEFTTVRLRWDPQCPVCGENPTVTELIDYDAFCGLRPGEAPAEAEHGVPTAVEA